MIEGRQPAPPKSRRARLHEIIFEADTPAGKRFDVALLWAILLSLATVMLESVSSIKAQYGDLLRGLEWFFTGLFTVEYALRIFCVARPALYMRSFFGLVDLLSILPTYLSFFIAGTQSLLVIRALRLLRVFRVLKLTQYLGEAQVLMAALRASRPKIIVFLGAVMTSVIIVGTAMYLIEGEKSGFDSIPRGMYWAIVTMTTVGYGDIAPQTVAGQALAALLMILGYAIIAIPIGIVSSELMRKPLGKVSTQACRVCGAEGHDHDASYCKYCGGAL
ncbi:MAG TPA: ion transporter [Bryobacterales bacterium]|nr:ion transporter [Bryobacterales bacterium]